MYLQIDNTSFILMIGCVYLLCVIKSIEEVIVKEISVRDCGRDGERDLCQRMRQKYYFLSKCGRSDSILPRGGGVLCEQVVAVWTARGIE